MAARKALVIGSNGLPQQLQAADTLDGAGSGTPGGSTTQVQYNNAGAFAGATEVEIENGQLRLEVNAGQLAPAVNGVKLIGNPDAGRVVPAWLSAAGKIQELQESLARSHSMLWAAVVNQNSFHLLGGTVGPTAVGTATAVAAIATTNYVSRVPRLEYLVTVAATTAIAGYRGTIQMVTVGGAGATEGGFVYISRWGPATGVATTTNRAFCGLRNIVSASTDVEFSTFINCVGMGWDAADANIQMMHNDGTGTCTKINLGASFPVPTVDRTSFHEIALYSPKGATQTIYYRVTDLVSGAVASGTISTDMPTNTTLLAPCNYMSVGGTSSVVGIGVAKMYLDPLI